MIIGTVWLFLSIGGLLFGLLTLGVLLFVRGPDFRKLPYRESREPTKIMVQVVEGSRDKIEVRAD